VVVPILKRESCGWHRQNTVIAALSVAAILAHLALRFGFRASSATGRPTLRRLGDRLGAVYTPVALTVAVIAWAMTGDPQACETYSCDTLGNARCDAVGSPYRARSTSVRARRFSVELKS
jgi:hypothetical protein